MRKLVLTILIVCALFVSTTFLTHPHFNKTVSTTLDGVDVKVTYLTVPANESYTRDAAVGQFIASPRAQLEISGELTAADVSVPAGKYTVGVVKNGENDWSLTLNPVSSGDSITLNSMFSADMGTADHILIDISPGHGEHEGMATLTIHFGTLFVSGALG